MRDLGYNPQKVLGITDILGVFNIWVTGLLIEIPRLKTLAITSIAGVKGLDNPRPKNWVIWVSLFLKTIQFKGFRKEGVQKIIYFKILLDKKEKVNK